MTPRCAAIVVAAGRGERLGAPVPKAFVEVNGWPLLVWATRPFCGMAEVAQVVVVAPKGWVRQARRALADAGLGDAIAAVVPGADHRTGSVKAGLRRLDAEVEVVAIQDGVRPLVTRDLIRRCLRAAARHSAAVACEASTDTLKQADPRTMLVTATLERARVWRAGTPQAFRREVIEAAYRAPRDVLLAATDDCTLVERMGLAPVVVPARSPNPKVTTPDDLRAAAALLAGPSSG